MRLSSTDEHPLRTIRHIAERSITVGDLAQRELWRAPPRWSATRIVAEMAKRNLDAAPVDEDPVRRFILRKELSQAPADATADELASLIDTRHLVTADLGLADGLRLLQDRPFVFVIERDRVVGIITGADLQRIPVSMVCLSLILAIEVGLNVLIGQH